MSMLKKRCFLFCLIVLVIGNIWFLNLKNDNSNLIGTYIDGEYASNIPSKDAGYVVEKIVCDNEAVGEWNYDDWGLLVKNMPKKSKCNVYFRKGIKLADTITLVDATGKCPTVNDDGSVNVTSAESENSLLCMAPDNYGNSYYFRGNVQNNYVYFANLYWRIIRINGDGSVRMIYDGTTAHENGEASSDRTIGNSQFNETDNDNAYAGYMYGTPSSSTYEETHANIHDSTIKKYIDSWYESNIKDTVYEKHTIISNFYTDRAILETNKYNGISNNMTRYKWYYAPWTTPQVLPTLIHSNKNDLLTSSLIALLDFDEAILAGVYNADNKSNYLYNGFSYWLLSPSDYNGTNAGVRRIDNIGRANRDRVINGHYVKPVINLKPNSLKLGDGTIPNAYRIS